MVVVKKYDGGIIELPEGESFRVDDFGCLYIFTGITSESAALAVFADLKWEWAQIEPDKATEKS